MRDRPGAGEAHVWYLWPDRVTDSARLAVLKTVLSDEELVQNQSFRFAEHRHSHLLTRAFVRTLLSQYADVKPEEWRFARTSYGKPEISGPPGALPVNFSLSHTRGLIVCALSTDCPVGIDAENLEPAADYMEIAQKHFSPAEYRSLQKTPADDLPRRFFEYWTLKESYAKAHGLGISMDLSAFAFQIEDGRIRIAFEAPANEDAQAWQFRLFRPDAHHIVAVSICGAGGSARVEFKECDGTTLML